MPLTYPLVCCLLLTIETVEAALHMEVLPGPPSVTGVIQSTKYEHVVVIPDTHGDAKSYINSLFIAFTEIEGPKVDIITFKTMFANAITPGSTVSQGTSERKVVVVQLGDLVDRGPFSLECIRITRAIPTVLGWETVSLIGNHELLSIMGESDHYIHPNEMTKFGSVVQRNAAFAPRGPNNFIYRDLLRNSIGIARLETMQRGNPQADPNTLFVHAGIELEWMRRMFGSSAFSAVWDIHAINREFRRYMSSQRGREHLSEDESLLWTRFLSTENDRDACALAEAVMGEFNVARIIVGHTPQSDFSAKTRCGGKVILLDAVMSEYMIPNNDGSFQGNPVVLVMTLHGDELSSMDVLYGDGERHNLFLQEISQRAIHLRTVPLIPYANEAPPSMSRIGSDGDSASLDMASDQRTYSDDEREYDDKENDAPTV